MTKHILIFAVMTFFFSCESQSETCANAIEFLVVDMTGLDGCGLIIENSSTREKFEALNLQEVFENVKAGDVFSGELKIESDFSSICQIGQIVSIICIE